MVKSACAMTEVVIGEGCVRKLQDEPQEVAWAYDKYDFDWDEVFQVMGIRDEIREVLFTSMSAFESRRMMWRRLVSLSGEENIVIISSDKDFQQLQKYSVSQLSDDKAVHRLWESISLLAGACDSRWLWWWCSELLSDDDCLINEILLPRRDLLNSSKRVTTWISLLRKEQVYDWLRSDSVTIMSKSTRRDRPIERTMRWWITS